MGNGVLPPVCLKLIWLKVGSAEPLPPLGGPQPKATLSKAQARGEQTGRRNTGWRHRGSVPFQAPLWGRPPLSLTPPPSRSPPRPSPGSLHYSDEDVTKYNDLIPAESSSLTEKPSEISDSQVRGRRARHPAAGTRAASSQSLGLRGAPSPGLPRLLAFMGSQETSWESHVDQPSPTKLCSVCSRANGGPITVTREDPPTAQSSRVSGVSPQAPACGGAREARRGGLHCQG